MDEFNEESEDNIDNEEDNKKNEIGRNSLKSNLKKGIGSLKDNIKGAIKGNAKDIFVLKAKAIVYGVLLGLVLLALIAEGISEDVSAVASSSVSSTFENSTTDSANLFNTTGSLIFATEDELNQINDSYMEEIKDSYETYYDNLNIKYSGKNSSTVANKVKHITTNVDTNETSEVNQITNSVSKVNGAVSLSDERTIFQHILRAEKYNFNNIVWRSFVKSGSGVTESSMSFQVDANSKLKYPVRDSKDTENDAHDLNFFITKTRAYLQSWYIPFDLAIGTLDQSDENLNTKFAYEIMASAYHEIILDRYKVETLTRTTNYRVYDKTTKTTTTTRKCADYNIKVDTKVEKIAGFDCSKEDYQLGLCQDSKMTVTKKCTRKNYNDGKYGCSDSMGRTTYTINCNDTWVEGCSYGLITKNIEKDVTVKRTLCVDEIKTDTKEEKDIRESISVSKDADNIKYRWDYVISLAKLFDNVISNDYKFEAFYNYSINNYEKFINKKDSYKNITIDEYKSSEETNSKADSYSHQDKDYYDQEIIPTTGDTSWNNKNVILSIPKNAVKISKTDSKKVISKTEEIIKEGKEYEDIYVWNDKLNFEGTKSGIYNIESIKDVTGDDLSTSETTYYNKLYNSQEINLIDLMNSNKDTYSTYLANDEKSSENIGIRKSALDISYSVLEKDLKETLEKYPLNGIKYGESLGLDINSFSTLSGLSFGSMENIAAGNMEGMNVTYTISNEDLNNAFLSVQNKIGQSYGYGGHCGIDISYSYSAADKSLCNDFSDRICPYMKGPAIYSTMDATIKEVGYSAYNKYHKVGQYLGNSYDGNMRISDTSGWGTYVKVENIDGTATIYAHLFPDRDFYKQLSENIGQTISAGTFLGYMGNTGNSSGLHLHIEFAQSIGSFSKVSNSSLTYVYLMKIINTMGINPNLK